MGISLSVLMKSKSLKNKLDSWMDKNFKTWNEVYPEYQEHSYMEHYSDGLPYAPKGNVVGLHGNSVGIEREYNMAVVRLLAMIAGSKVPYPKLKADDGEMVKPNNIDTAWFFWDDMKCPIYTKEFKGLVPSTWGIVDDLGRSTSDSGLTFVRPKALRKMLDSKMDKKARKVMEKELKKFRISLEQWAGENL